MALGIEGASHGYDANNTQRLINNINVKCVGDTVAAINLGLGELRRAVDAAWVGASAEKFKQKMEKDANDVSKAIREAGDGLTNYINAVTSKMADVDNSITF